MLEEETSQAPSTLGGPAEVDQAAIYFKAAGGEKKQRVYGLGSQASVYYGCGSSSAAGCSEPSTTSAQASASEVARLQAEIVERDARLQSLQAQLDTHQDILATFDQRVDERVEARVEVQRRQMEDYVRGLISSMGIPPLPPQTPPADDDSTPST